MNFLHHWSLEQNPFAPVASPEGFYAGRGHREAIARMEALTRLSTSSAVLFSERGCGVTTLLRRVAGTSGLGNAAIDAVMTSGGVQSIDAALARLAVELAIDPFAGRLEQRISHVIGAAARHQVRTLWLIDRCDAPTAQAAAMLAATNRSLCTVLALSSQSAPTLPDELEGFPLRIDLLPFDLDDTIGFVRFCVATAGATDELFDDAALVRLHELSDGKVAWIAATAQWALMTAASRGAPRVSAECVELAQQHGVRAA